jgi:hypothetical protein
MKDLGLNEHGVRFTSTVSIKEQDSAAALAEKLFKVFKEYVLCRLCDNYKTPICSSFFFFTEAFNIILCTSRQMEASQSQIQFSSKSPERTVTKMFSCPGHYRYDGHFTPKIMHQFGKLT